VPLALAGLFYLARRFTARYPARTGMPRQSEFLVLPVDAQAPYWRMLRTFLAVIALWVQVLFAIVQTSMIRTAVGQAHTMPVALFLAAMAVLFLLLLFYLPLLLIMPGRLVARHQRHKEDNP
jgi:hypothetical protein